jgi:hypothetical protein
MPSVQLTVHEHVPMKLVIPGSAWLGGRGKAGDGAQWALAKAIATANGLRLATVWLDTDGAYHAALSTRRTIGHGCYLPAAEVTFRVAKSESQGEK